MTATDLHSRALAVIAERRALIAAGTPGPWGWRHFGDDPDNLCRIVHYPPYDSGDDWSVPADDIGNPADAALIVAAVNDYGPLLDLAEHTLLRHAPMKPFPGSDGEACGLCARNVIWPCRDAAAALRSVGVDHDE